MSNDADEVDDDDDRETWLFAKDNLKLFIFLP